MSSTPRRRFPDRLERPRISSLLCNSVTIGSVPEPNEERYLRELFEHLDVGVIIANDEGMYVDVNGEACRLFDRSREELIGHRATEFVEGAREDEVSIQWKAFLRDGEQSGQFAIMRRDRTPRWLRFHARANFVPGLHCSFLTEATPAQLQPGNSGLLTLCAWTKQVLAGGSWITLEDYLERAHGVRVTHSISPEAFSRMIKR